MHQLAIMHQPAIIHQQAIMLNQITMQKNITIPIQQAATTTRLLNTPPSLT